MDFKKRIATLLIISFVNQICMSPVLAVYDDIESLEHHKSELRAC